MLVPSCFNLCIIQPPNSRIACQIDQIHPNPLNNRTNFCLSTAYDLDGNPCASHQNLGGKCLDSWTLIFLNVKQFITMRTRLRRKRKVEELKMNGRRQDHADEWLAHDGRRSLPHCGSSLSLRRLWKSRTVQTPLLTHSGKMRREQYEHRPPYATCFS